MTHKHIYPSTHLQIVDSNFSTTKLCYKLIENKYLDENGKIREEYKFKLNFPEFGITNSKFLAKKDEKFDTYLFLPEGEGREGEGGLRTKGLFKFNYKLGMLNDGLSKDIQNSKFKIQNPQEWYICDFDGNPIMPAPDNIQQKIWNYVKNNNRAQASNNLSQFTSHGSQFTNHSSPITDLPLTSYPLPLDHISLITIITVVYNGEKYLEETIKSVINQIYPNVEYIIIDGGSTDRTLDIIKRYEDYIDYWVSEKDEGIYDAMNKGVELAFGNLIGILGGDDIFFSKALEYVSSFSKYDAIVGPVKLSTGKIKYGYRPQYKYFGPGYCITSHSIGFFVKKKIYKMIGMYNLKYYQVSDGDFIYKVMKITNNIKSVEKDCLFGIFNVSGVSNKKRFRQILENALVMYENGIPKTFVIGMLALRLIKNFFKI